MTAFVKPMLASAFDDHCHKLTYPVLVQPKLDGIRIIADVSNGTVTFYSRALKPLPAFDHAAPAVLEAVQGQDCILDGELIGVDFTEAVSAGRRKYVDATTLKMMVFDVVPLHNAALQPGTPCAARLAWLTANVVPNERVQVISSKVARSALEVQALADEAVGAGLEGVMVKTMDGDYRIGKRSIQVLKVKKHDTLDLPVFGVEEGTGKYVGMLGALVVRHNGKRICVGTGFTDEQRELFWQDRAEIVGMTAEVGFMEITAAGSLRHPSFIRMREDK